jgi:hypothetical protein
MQLKIIVIITLLLLLLFLLFTSFPYVVDKIVSKYDFLLNINLSAALEIISISYHHLSVFYPQLTSKRKATFYKISQTNSSCGAYRYMSISVLYDTNYV